MNLDYDLIVVGGGHAGCEAACASANMGISTLLITMDMTKFGQMSCNPAMGGIAKGQLVREIDALGGYSGIITDTTTIQFRMLNKSKGPAMWSPRAQCDRTRFSLEWRKILESVSNLDLWQDTVTELIINKDSVEGVITKLGVRFKAKIVVLTNGTFINGIIHVGRNTSEGGRISEPSSKGISEQLKEYGFSVGRMKTGTPARLDGRSIDFGKLVPQFGEENSGKFSFLPEIINYPTLKECYTTYTNNKVHRILERGFVESPLYTGRIKGIGPRYCPSIEDKIVTFASKEQHQLFIEPEGLDTNEYYINGFSSSLPWNIQYEALRCIQGLENVKIYRPGYAIEYDFYPPTQLHASLETKFLKNLFFAGQINGTTGYEEAAAQGLLAGINGALKIKNKEALILNRNQAYIGVLIDDLVTKGVDEPYRMFTSRAEYRVLLRQDDADSRLTPLSNSIGLASDNRLRNLESKYKIIRSTITKLKEFSIKPQEVNDYLSKIGTSPIKQGQKAYDLVSRPQVDLKSVFDIIGRDDEFLAYDDILVNEAIQETEIQIKYFGYIEREKIIADKLKRLESITISPQFNYNNLKSLSTEARQKLSKIKPETIGQASRISGINPSDINILLVYLGR